MSELKIFVLFNVDKFIVIVNVIWMSKLKVVNVSLCHNTETTMSKMFSMSLSMSGVKIFVIVNVANFDNYVIFDIFIF